MNRFYLNIDTGIVHSLSRAEFEEFLLEGIAEGWVNASLYGRRLGVKRSREIQNSSLYRHYWTLDWSREDYEDALKYEL